MSDRSPKCSKCNAPMTAGFVADFFHKSLIEDSASQLEWTAGDPSGARVERLAGRARRKVTTYACNACGFLESYVDPQGG